MSKLQITNIFFFQREPQSASGIVQRFLHKNRAHCKNAEPFARNRQCAGILRLYNGTNSITSVSIAPRFRIKSATGSSRNPEHSRRLRPRKSWRHPACEDREITPVRAKIPHRPGRFVANAAAWAASIRKFASNVSCRGTVSFNTVWIFFSSQLETQSRYLMRESVSHWFPGSKFSHWTSTVFFQRQKKYVQPYLSGICIVPVREGGVEVFFFNEFRNIFTRRKKTLVFNEVFSCTSEHVQY